MANKTIGFPTPSKKSERLLSQLISKIINTAVSNFEIGVLNRITNPNPFADNYATDYMTLVGQAKRKTRGVISDAYIKKEVMRIMNRADNRNKKTLLSIFSRKFKVGNKTPLIFSSRGVNPNINALMVQTLELVKALRDDTLKSLSQNTLRTISQGGGLDEVIKEFNTNASKMGSSGRNLARSQIVNFNALSTKVRQQALGITQGIWKTTGGKSGDGRARECHIKRHNKVFDLDKGCYSSCDKKWLFVGVDYNCRCTYKAILPDLDSRPRNTNT